MLLPPISYPVSGVLKTPFHLQDCTDIFAPFILSIHRLTDLYRNVFLTATLKTEQFSLQILDNGRLTH